MPELPSHERDSTLSLQVCYHDLVPDEGFRRIRFPITCGTPNLYPARHGPLQRVEDLLRRELNFGRWLSFGRVKNMKIDFVTLFLALAIGVGLAESQLQHAHAETRQTGGLVSGFQAIDAQSNNRAVVVQSGQVDLTFTQSPQSTTVSEGKTHFFTVAATGTGPILYQWRWNGHDIPGATKALLPLGPVRTNQTGNYAVVLTGVSGSITSSPALLTVSPSPAGAVVAWGRNTGDNQTPTGQITVPPQLSNVVSIAGGVFFSMALKSNGTITTWGKMLGSDTAYVEATVPDGLTDVEGIAGLHRAIAVRRDGTVVAWGNNFYGQTNIPPGLSDVRAVASGIGHNLALKSDGTVVAWGGNAFGQTDIPPGLTGVVSVAAGFLHSVALKNDGSVVAWGGGSAVVPGNSAERGQSLIPMAAEGEIVAIAAGGYLSMALKADGTLIAWGDNDFGQTNVPAGLTGVIDMAVGGGYHCLALKKDGTVVAWGSNSDGQTEVPIGLSGVATLAGGTFHSLAVTTNALLPIRVLVDGVYVPGGSADRYDQAIVTLLTAFTNSTIYYSTDGTQPFVGGPVVYHGPFTITNNTPIRALAVNLNDFSTATSERVNVTIIATYPLTLLTPGGGTLSANPPGPRYLSNSVVTVTATPAAGWTFLYWIDGTSGTGLNNDLIMDRPRSVQGIFGTPLSTGVVGSGRVSLSQPQILYPFGTTARLTAIPDLGSFFSTWGGVTNGNFNPIDFSVKTPTATISALFTTLGPGQVNAYITTTGNGTVALSPQKPFYTTGEVLTLTATPGAGYQFRDWSGDATGTTSPLTLLIDANKVITANFVTSNIPNLTPFRPNGWSDKLIATVANDGPIDSGTIYDDQEVFVGWAIINNGSAATTDQFASEIRVDGIARNFWTNVPPMHVSESQEIQRFSIGRLTAGSHSLEIRADTTSLISEGNEGDNTYSKNIMVTHRNSPFVPRAGVYRGIILGSPAAFENAGYFQIATTLSGTFSGRFILAGVPVPVSGRFQTNGSFSRQVLIRGANMVTLRLQMQTAGGSEQVAGSLSNSQFTVNLIGDLAGYSSRNPAPQAGRYTLLFPGSSAPGEPNGCGYATVIITPLGGVNIRAVLADGTPFTEATTLSKSGEWPLYGGLYSGRGVAVGRLSARSLADRDLDGDVFWSRPATATHFFPGGFSIHCGGIGSRYASPGAGLGILNFGSGTNNAFVNYGTGDSTNQVLEVGTFDLKSRLTVSPTADKIKFSFRPTDGVFTGTFINFGDSRPTAFQGAVLQKKNIATGYFIGKNASGFISIAPRH